MAGTVLSGGCLCGGTRYAVRYAAAVVDYCHCGMCRKAGGGVVTAWLQVAPEDFRLTAGAASAFRSSARATRHFCPTCGAQLYMTDDEGRSVGITVATLDDPAMVPPTVHGWDSARIPWCEFADDLPRYPEDPPYDL